MTVRRLAMVIAALPVLALAGCGGTAKDTGIASVAGRGSSGAAPSASPTTSSDPLKFAQCMREHGIDMEDPKDTGDGKVSLRINTGDKNKVEAAQKVCGKYMQRGGGRLNEDNPQTRDAMLQFARCMREHGVDMADPKPGEGLTVPKGTNPRAGKFEAAHKACEKHLPGASPGK
ncbi:hypothetical protein [Sphaerisporangium perillae]|uniref:hypothetical protein n=1 Tax=Sphaerisporangium perillae TaxID=2935860 RepID=UPI00200CF51A|nr:hypothetical protein [Sphaerisporangium perillae]